MAIDKGNDEAMLNYASNYLSEDDEERIKLFKQAADKGNADGIYKLGYILAKDNNNNTPEQRKEAAKYLKMAFKNGIKIAMHDLALMLKKGSANDKYEAAQYFKISISIDFICSLLDYTKWLEENEDFNHALKYYQKGIKKGLVLFMVKYAQFRSNHNSEFRDAAYYYKMAIESDNHIFSEIDRCYNRIFADYERDDDDFDEEKDLIDEFIEDTTNYFQELYRDYEYGRFILDNEMENVYFKKKTAEAMVSYADLILHRIPSSQEEKIKALGLIIAAIYCRESADAMFAYARLRDKGDIIYENDYEAQKYYKMAHDKNHPEAQHYKLELISREYDKPFLNSLYSEKVFIVLPTN